MPWDIEEGLRSGGAREAFSSGRYKLAEGIEKGIDPPEELEQGVILAGRVRWIYAPAGKGKTWLWLWLVKRCIERGERALIFDSENGMRLVTERLQALGVGPERVDELLHYYPFPHLSTDDRDAEDYARLLDEIEPALVIFDSLVNFLGDSALAENSNDDLVAWATCYTRPARERGIAVVVLDHVPHEGDHARGASRKRDEVAFSLRLRGVYEGVSMDAWERAVRTVVAATQRRPNA